MAETDSIAHAGHITIPYLLTDSINQQTGVAKPDSIAAQVPIVLQNPAEGFDVSPISPDSIEGSGGSGMSWLFLVLAVIFSAVALRMRNSRRQLEKLVSDLTDTRARNNVFDDTVNETSFMVLLNVLWAASAGILLWQYVRQGISTDISTDSWYGDRSAIQMGICAGIAAGYVMLINLAYYVVGNVFTEMHKAQQWVRGSAAATALESPIMLMCALLTLFYPGWIEILLIIAASVFIIGKIVFICKGFRIFFSQLSSWLLFLYYLCSLEIVPIIMIYIIALTACTRL